MSDYEAIRQRKIAQNNALAHNLGIKLQANPTKPQRPRALPSKKRKLDISAQPTRTSARIAAAPIRTTYDEDVITESEPRGRTKTAKSRQPKIEAGEIPNSKTAELPASDIEGIRSGWTDWKPIAPPPTRDDVTGMFHFESHPDFTPNKSPAEMLHEGCFGGSYFRPLYSSKLHTTVADDWRELPEEWIDGLSVERFLTSPEYDADVNKYKVSCGQSIEQWEQNGWIDHRHDVRGWFQWYCRFFIGRRCDDDERQVSRWAKCVGPRGRWRRTLLKKYKTLGIRDVMDYGDDEDAPDVSPVVHQTCHHWAFEVRQGVLDEFWNGEGG